jgi:hypothetical protein
MKVKVVRSKQPCGKLDIYKIYVGNCCGKTSIGRQKHGCEYSVIMDLEKMYCKDITKQRLLRSVS